MTVSRTRLGMLWLTLFAFGVQIVVADFHHHIARGAGMEARAMTAGLCRPSRDRPCSPSQNDHDGCVLCWAASIAATSLTPVLFDIPLPSAAVGIRISAAESYRVRHSRFTDVRARGPPTTVLG